MEVKDLCQVDDRNKAFGISIEQLDKSLNEIQISPLVPESILDMTVLARKICLYSYFEYDFYSVFLIYLFLVAETAVKVRFIQELPKRCTMIRDDEKKVVYRDFQNIFNYLIKRWKIQGYRKIDGSLASVLKWLKKQAILPDRISYKDIKLIKDLRNKSAHLKAQNILMPSMVVPVFWKLLDFINCLFDPSVHDKEPAIINEMRKESERVRNLISDEREVTMDDDKIQVEFGKFDDERQNVGGNYYIQVGENLALFDFNERIMAEIKPIIEKGDHIGLHNWFKLNAKDFFAKCITDMDPNGIVAKIMNKISYYFEGHK